MKFNLQFVVTCLIVNSEWAHKRAMRPINTESYNSLFTTAIKELKEKCLLDGFSCIYSNDLIHSPKSKIKATLERFTCIILFRRASERSIKVKYTDA